MGVKTAVFMRFNEQLLHRYDMAACARMPSHVPLVTSLTGCWSRALALTAAQLSRAFHHAPPSAARNAAGLDALFHAVLPSAMLHFLGPSRSMVLECTVYFYPLRLLSELSWFE
jgi:hypothetical protein